MPSDGRRWRYHSVFSSELPSWTTPPSSDSLDRHLRGGFTSTRFVLVEPSHPGNVGAAARALKTMGFARLVLVAPRVPHVKNEPEAIAMASGADDVLASAHVVDTLADALAGVHWSVALTARMREYGPPQLPPRAAAERAHELVRARRHRARVRQRAHRAVERGRRALQRARAHSGQSGLQLAESGAGGAGARLRTAARVLERRPRRPRCALGESASASASSDEIEGMYAHLENALVALDFLDPANPKKLMSRVRRLFARSGLEREEVNILRGIAKHILLRTKKDGERDAACVRACPMATTALRGGGIEQTLRARPTIRETFGEQPI